MPTIRSNLSIPLNELSRIADDQKEVDQTKQRDSSKFRPLCVKCGVFGTQDGSGYAEFGNTRVLAQIFGPDGDGKWEDSYAKITLNLKGVEDETKLAEYRAEIISCISSVIFVQKYPGKVIDIEITVISDDGGALSTALTAVSLALAHSGIEHVGLTTSAHVVLRNDEYITDPSTSESEGVIGGVTFSFVPNLGQSTGINLYGRVPIENVKNLLEFARQKAISLVPVIHKAIVKSVDEMK